MAEAERSEQATPTFKQQVALQASSGRRPLDPARARVLYKCTDCHGTVAACRHRISVGASLREARGDAVRAGVAPPEIGWLRERFATHGSPYARDLPAALEDAAPGTRAQDGPLGIFPACTALAHHPDEVVDALTVLRRVEPDAAAVLPDPPCCGYPLDAAGLEEAFAAHAARVAESLAGVGRVVPLGGACAHTLAVRYRQVGVEPRFTVSPLVDLLAAHADRWRELTTNAPAGVHAYHDPCFLSRRLGRSEEPRAVLRAVLGREPRELGYARADTRCSGGGGVYPLTHPGPARRCAEAVLALAREAGVETLVTGCPSARRRLTRAEPEFAVRGLINVVAEAIAAGATSREA